MNDFPFLHLAIFLGAVLLAALSQVLLKRRQCGSMTACGGST